MKTKLTLFVTCVLSLSVAGIATARVFSNYFSTTPNDVEYANQWAITKTKLNQAWDIYTGSSTIKVGIIDSGIDYTHEDLYENVNASLGAHFGNSNISHLQDNVGHGTFVSGIVGARGNNTTGISGACWDTDIISLSVATSSSSSVYLPGIADAIVHASDSSHSIEILNASVGAPYSILPNYVPDVIEMISDFNIAISNYTGLLVCAAGNGSNFGSSFGRDIDQMQNYIFPASFSSQNILVVGNSDSSDNRATSSNYGSTNVDLFAPGENIKSTLPVDNYGILSGTSFSAPLVAGTATLLKSIKPTLTSLEIKSAILDNVDVVDGLNGLCVSGGRLNAYSAVLSILDEIYPNANSIIFSSTADYQSFFKINCSAGHYSLEISSNLPYRATLYSKYTGTPIAQVTSLHGGDKTINFLSSVSKTVFLRVENLGTVDSDVELQLSYNAHNYLSSYSNYNNSYHKAFCSCGEYVLMPHLVMVHIPNNGYGTCAICSATVPLDNSNGFYMIENNDNISQLSPFDILQEPILRCYTI